MREELLLALHTLYHQSDENARKDADRWLASFQQMPEAWQVADALLHDPKESMESKYFCSQTIRTKCQNELEDLPEDSIFSLRNSLIDLLFELPSEASMVRTQLCLALVSIVSQSSNVSLWEGKSVISWFASRSNVATSDGSIQSTLEFLNILPQEAFSPSTSLRPSRRRQFYQEMVLSGVEALQMLAAYCASSIPSKSREKLMQSFASWLRLNQGITINIGTVVAHPLTQAALLGLREEEFFDAAVNVVVELIWYCKPDEHGHLDEEQRPLANSVIAAVVSLRNLLEANNEAVSNAEESVVPDEEVVKGAARLFAELGEAFLPLVAAGTPDVVPLLDALVSVASHPDNDICAISFPFWQLLSEEILESQPKLRETRLEAFFRPVFSKLVQVICLRVREPEDFDGWRTDQKVEFKEAREAVAETLQDAGRILDGDTIISLLADPLQTVALAKERGEQVDWRNAEAILYCVRMMAGCPPSIANPVFASILKLALELDQPSTLAYTSTLMVGSYADWIAAALRAGITGVPQPSHIMETLSARLGSQSTASAASLAIRHICNACAPQLSSFLEGLMTLLHCTACAVGQIHSGSVVVPPSQLSAPELLHISEAVGFVISALSSEDQRAVLGKLVNMLMVELKAYHAALDRTKCASSNWTSYIDPITAVFSVLSSHSAVPVATAYMQSLPGIDLMLVSNPRDEKAAEHACRVVKYAARVGVSATESGIDILHPSLELLHKHYHLGKHACYLYATSELVKKFGSTPSSGLAALVSEMLQTSCNQLSSPEAVAAHPDVADDTFSLAGRCLAYAPWLLDQGSVLLPLADAAKTAMLVNHKDANIGSLLFLHRLLKATTRPADHTNQWLPVVARDATISSGHGQVLMLRLFAGIAGAIPEDRLEDLGDLLYTLIVITGQEGVEWACTILGKIPSISATQEECSQLAQYLSGAAHKAIRFEQFMAGVGEFATLCRRNTRSREAVMSVLLS